MSKSKKTTKEAKKPDIQTGPSCIVIFGAAGYIGRMLCDQFSVAPDIKEIIAIDKEPIPEILKKNKKITWVSADLSEDEWQGEVRTREPEVAIHASWDLDKNADGVENFSASEKIFRFCFDAPSLKKIIYLSSILPYGADQDNNIKKIFSEGEIFREKEYPYALQRKEVEASLAMQYSGSNRTKSVFILRPGIVYGPMGASIGSFNEPLLKMIRSLPFIFDAGTNFGLQYIHEDDLVDLLAVLVFNKLPFKGYEVFNVVTSEVIDIKEIADSLGKSVVKFPFFFAQLFISLFGSRYSDEVSKNGAWKYLCYPVFADGRKLVKKLKFEFLYSAHEAFFGSKGRYSYLVPPAVEKEGMEEEVCE